MSSHLCGFLAGFSLNSRTVPAVAGLAAVFAAASLAMAAEVTPVDGKRILNADKEPRNWLSHGRTYSEQRYSPLDKINDKNVAKLGVAWSFEMPRQARHGGNPAGDRRPHVHDVGLVCGLRTRRQDRRAFMDLRSQGAAQLGQARLLRRGEPRRRGLGRQGLCRHDRRPTGRARSADRQGPSGTSTRSTGRRPTRSPARRASSKAR